MSNYNNENVREEQRTRLFNPNEHLIQLKSKNGAADYLPVQWRLVWFRTLCPDGTIETEMVHLDLNRETEEEIYAWNGETRRSEKTTKRANGFVVFRAAIKDGKGGSATATKSEKAASFPDYIEKAETGAVGRLRCVARGPRRGNPDGLGAKENTQTWASAERTGACDGACVQSPQPFRRYRLLAAAEVHAKKYSAGKLGCDCRARLNRATF